DLPEEMAKKRVEAYLANTGYGWGLKYGVGLSEELVRLLGEQIISGSISIGQAMADAKRQYVLEQGRYDGFDEKVVHEFTRFGIPTYLVVTDPLLASAPQQAGATKLDGIHVQRSTTPILQAGAPAAPVVATLPTGVTELNLNFNFGPGTYQVVNTPDG